MLFLKIVIVLLVIAGIAYWLFFKAVDKVVTNRSEGFVLIDEKISNSYFIKEGRVYYCMSGNFFSVGEVLIESADIDTFAPIDSSFARDKRYVYAREKILDDADPDTFKSLGELFYGDKQSVYFYDRKIEIADPLSFSTIDGQFSKDKSHLFFLESVVKGVDPNAFKYTPGMYAESDENGDLVLKDYDGNRID